MDDKLSVKVERDQPATMRDGTVLRADVYWPRKSGAYPVIVCRTPYDKGEGTVGSFAEELASRGYIVVAQDIRGRYKSDGDFHWFFKDNSETYDGPDGYDTVEWAASIDDSSGKVGTWGFSYPGWCVWRMAETRPPHLKALHAGGIAMRETDMTFGVLDIGRRLQWTYGMAADARRRVEDETGPGSRAEANAHWDEVERSKWLWYLPLGDMPDQVLGPLTPMFKDYLREINVDHWRFADVHSKVNVPTHTMTGWYDRLIGTINNYAGMVANGPEELRDRHRIVVGPWGHSSDGERRLGPLDFGAEAETTYADELSRWYDHQLKGVDNGLGGEPPVKLFIMGENRWRYESEWPLARTRYTDFHLHSGGSANTARGDGSLSMSAASTERPDEYDYDPRDPVMSLMELNSQNGARDQAPLAHRRDILVYQTARLEKEIEVTGPVMLKLWAASSAPDTDFTAKLVDVHPDGMAVNLTYGILRASHRNGMANPSLIELGRPYEYTVRLNPTGILFEKGHRIRLDVSSSDFPNFDRNHNTGADFWSDAELRVAHQTVYHDSEHPSRLILPLIPR